MSIFEAVPGQSFRSFPQWVNMASSWLTRHPDFNDTQHGNNKGWRGHHFTALCFDQKWRRCRIGADFQRADDEGAFPVWWVWPDQIPQLVERIMATEARVKVLEGAVGHALGQFIVERSASGAVVAVGYAHTGLRPIVETLNAALPTHERGGA